MRTPLSDSDFSSSFMDSLGSVVSFFSQKVKEKVALLRQQSTRHSSGAEGRHEVRLNARPQTQTGKSPLLLMFSPSRPIVLFDPWWKQS